MPRRPKLEKRTTTVIVDDTPITVVLHPPTGSRKSWYAYWNGLVSSKSTGQPKYDDAVLAVEHMLKSGGKRASLQETVLSDEELESLQRVHFTRKTDPDARSRAAKTLEDCLDALNAFKALSGLPRIATATPDDCARFQTKALTLPKDWRQARPNREEDSPRPNVEEVERLSPNTVHKWSRQLQAAFERANQNASRRKCVRGVVDQRKLLSSNPWGQFTWIEGRDRGIRQFDGHELLSLLSYLESAWKGVAVAPAAAKVFLWSACRKLEVATLSWDSLRDVGGEFHFEVIGKHRRRKWFRIPPTVYHELLDLRTDSPFVFAGYSEQLRQFHSRSPNWLRKVQNHFNPGHFGRWFYYRVKDWAAEHGKGDAYVYIFRKTTLQHARRGEDINRLVATDAGVSEGVLVKNYVQERDEELWARSNRTYARIIASIPQEVARRYGHVEDGRTALEHQVQAAFEAGNWDLAGELTARLAKDQRSQAG
jgi:hypothetical protein